MAVQKTLKDEGRRYGIYSSFSRKAVIFASSFRPVAQFISFASSLHL
jgi:hypothetical protein